MATNNGTPEDAFRATRLKEKMHGGTSCNHTSSLTGRSTGARSYFSAFHAAPGSFTSAGQTNAAESHDEVFRDHALRPGVWKRLCHDSLKSPMGPDLL
jgi:hypothetical protein